ncbi:MAG: transcriptional regulator [Rhodoferax sp.]|jgi:HTH-type transcriptional regulator/antitoxin HigA|uniref:helix-turn-helix domain-containing protein n=2 Tax=Rhodoferax sp. TaxID=50421 RepID=UPI003BB784EB
MEIRPIRTEDDYKTALREVSAYFDNEPAPGTPDGDRFEIMTPKDLVPAIGRLNRVYEILNRKRPLTLPMIWKLHEKLGIPAECLIQPPKATV